MAFENTQVLKTQEEMVLGQPSGMKVLERCTSSAYCVSCRVTINIMHNVCAVLKHTCLCWGCSREAYCWYVSPLSHEL